MEDCHQWAPSESWDHQGQCYYRGRKTRKELSEGEIGGSRLSSEPGARKLRHSETVTPMLWEIFVPESQCFPKAQRSFWRIGGGPALPWQSSKDHQLHQSSILAQCTH